jgi:hypothetical protein
MTKATGAAFSMSFALGAGSICGGVSDRQDGIIPLVIPAKAGIGPSR